MAATRKTSKAVQATRTAKAGASSDRLARVDGEILRLLHKRAQLTQQLAQADPSAAVVAVQATADEQWIQSLSISEKSGMPAEVVAAVFREILSGCRSLLRPLRVAFLGPQHSYSHLAALHRFGTSFEPLPVGTIAAVFEEVNRGQCDFGIVPIENSTDGRIADTLDMFTRLPVRICGEVDMRIHHALLAKCPRAEVREVYSRPQALSQCRNWLAKHLPQSRLIEVTSTTTAAQLAKEKPGAAAIASIQAGVFYGLDLLAERIEDNPTNTTRFAVIGEHVLPKTGNDKTALLFQVEHRPGTLADAMGIFKRNRLNLTWIESLPVPGSRGIYLFFVEMEGHSSESRIAKALESLGRKTLRLEVLGSFPASETVD